MRGGARRALIFGISGQDGAYLANLLLDCGYKVFGTSRDREIRSFHNLETLGVAEQISLSSATPTDFRSVFAVIDAVQPDEIYNLAGQSSVRLSFDQPVETVHSMVDGTLNILEAIRMLGGRCRFYQASSSESFGNIGEAPADESTAFRPRSPYGVGKAAAHWAVANYRESYGLFACAGILFNHESPLRPARFATQKIIRGAADIADGKTDRLALGRLDISRDWGWAPEYVEAMHRIISHDTPEDFVIATGTARSLENFVERTFACFGLNWRDHVEVDSALLRPSDISHSVGNPAKAMRELHWRAKVAMPDLVDRLVEAELRRRRDLT